VSELDASARRRVGVLATAQLWGGLGVSAGLASGALLAKDVTGRASLSGLPQTASVLGAALLAVPLARLAGRSGRRVALLTGFAVAAVGAGLVVVAAATRAFPLLLVATALAGGGTAAGLQARFAATDGVAKAAHGRVLSTVVWAGTVGAVLGPNLLTPGAALARRLSLPDLAGPWVLAVCGLAIAGTVVAVWLRADASATRRRRSASIPTVLRALARHRQAAAGIAAIATAHPVMVGVMAMTSVHLSDAGSSLRVIGLVISLHVFGMFGLSPVFGWLVDRWGELRVVWLGGGLLASGASAAAWGGALDNAARHADGAQVVGVGLFLIGLGWSACLIAGSALVAHASHEADVEVSHTDVQGASDLVMGLSGATAGALSGVVLSIVGYVGLAVGGALLVAPLVLFTAVRRRAIVENHPPVQT
jgi:MFS family permease